MNNLKNLKGAIWGIAFIIVGVILGLNTMGITNINIFFSGWWTLFIIIPAVFDLFSNTERTSGIIWLCIGVILLLGSNGVIDWDIIGKLAVPVALCIIGLSILTNNLFNKKIVDKVNELNTSSEVKDGYAATFSGEKIKYPAKPFTSLNLDAVFGGIELDLTDAKIQEDVVINASAIFGGIDIKVPQNINVQIKPVGIFGGTSNKTVYKEGNPTIYINSTAIFGGVEIK